MSNIDNKNPIPKIGTSKETNYDYIYVEISTDIDKTSETFGAKYIHVSFGDYIHGRVREMYHIKADRFVIEHHTLEQKDQIKETKHNCQTFYSRDFDNSI